MSNVLKRLPIRLKIVALVAGVSGLVLALATLAFAVAEHRAQRATMVSSATALTRVLALNASAAVLFDDKETAGEILNALSEQPQVLAGWILKPDGSRVADYTKPAVALGVRDEIAESPFRPSELTETRFFDLHFAVSQRIRIGPRSVGFIDLRFDLAPLRASAMRLLYTAALVLTIGVLVAFLLASALQRLLSRPLIALMQTMEQVSGRSDYALRARVFGEDELATLTRGFNGMLEQIQRRDEALGQAMADLEVAKQAAESASAAKSSFLATMSHEIRTPITGVMGMTELLLSSYLPSAERRLAESAHRSVKNLLSLINDILDFSRIEAGRLELEQTGFDLQRVLNDVVEVLRTPAVRKGISIEARLAPDSPRHLIGDANRLRQILLNLAGNGVKFTEHGGVTIQAETQRHDEAEVTLSVRVQDTGIGIRQEALTEIFDQFSQAETSTARRFGGSGLGLAISRKLARLMGGDIQATSLPGRGSTFCLDVCLRLDPHPASSEPSETSWEALPDGLVGHVLVAEDNPVNQQLAEGMLARLGCRVALAGDGQEAYQRVMSESFDLVLMDCHMPELDGMDATRLIRAWEGEGQRIPIIALTADVQPETAEKCLQAGMDAYLGKPYTGEQLVRVLARFLESGEPPSSTLCAEPGPMEAEDGVIEPAALKEIRALQPAGKPDVLSRVVSLFVADTSSTLTQIRESLALGHSEDVRRAAHRIKSSAAHLGALRLSRQCAELERLAAEGQLSETKGLMAPLEAEYARAAAALQRECRT